MNTKFDTVIKKFFKEDINMNTSAAKAVTSPQITQAVGNALKQAGAQADAVKALGSTLMSDPHVQDFNKLLDPKNQEFKNVGDFLKKHQDLAPRFAELGLVQPEKKTETTSKPQNQTDTTSQTNTTSQQSTTTPTTNTTQNTNIQK